MVRRANHSAVRLVQLLLQYIPGLYVWSSSIPCIASLLVLGFRDTSLYQGHLVHFYKRAQILVADVWAAYGRKVPRGEQEASNPFAFADMEYLTMFADYRVPQLLRHMSVLQYSSELSGLIDARTPLASGSEMEVEIRAATVVAVEQLKTQIRELQLNQKKDNATTDLILSVEIDWLLWNIGENTKDEIAPHHRTLSIYY